VLALVMTNLLALDPLPQFVPTKLPSSCLAAPEISRKSLF
jgi:hypothetical protein